MWRQLSLARQDSQYTVTWNSFHHLRSVRLCKIAVFPSKHPLNHVTIKMCTIKYYQYSLCHCSNPMRTYENHVVSCLQHLYYHKLIQIVCVCGWPVPADWPYPNPLPIKKMQQANYGSRKASLMLAYSDHSTSPVDWGYSMLLKINLEILNAKWCQVSR
jgi:hypothetical protein